MNEPSLNAEVALALERFGLITMDQAEEAVANWRHNEYEAWKEANWWNDTATIAWKNQASLWSRVWNTGVPPWTWKLDWIKEKRGW